MTFWRAEDIAYCANVHPAANCAELFNTIRERISVVRKALGLERLSCGLWVNEQSLKELAHPSKRAEFRGLLKEHKIEVRSFNGFPQRNFHTDRVKSAVYLPHWGDPRRLLFTMGLADLLLELNPDSQSPLSISTLPLGFINGWQPLDTASAIRNLLQFVRTQCALIEAGKPHVQLCLEMEPRCVLESTPQLLVFFDRLFKAGVSEGISKEFTSSVIGVCFDICHQAVMFESVADVYANILDAGISVPKIQVSSAPKILCHNPHARELTLAFVEDRYLHQSALLDAHGIPHFFEDLPELAHSPHIEAGREARIHFHVPIQEDRITLTLKSGESADCDTTQDEILAFLDTAIARKQRPYLEIETYTWSVLPKVRSKAYPSIETGIAKEYQWLCAQLKSRGAFADA